MPSALTDLRVLDCTHVVAGSYCSMLLADLGADVVKIEPLAGESTRGRGGSAFRAYDFLNRNKRAIAVDLQTSEGVAVIQRLARSADVFVENFRPGALDELGLGHDALKAINPRLVYCSISGFGHDGPYRQRGGFDLIAQAMSGIMSFTGDPGGARPVAAGVPLSDLNAGLFGALAVLAAIHERRRSSQGQKVEATLLESALGYTLWESGLYMTTGEVARPKGSRHRLAAPYGALKARDGFIVVGVNNQKLWARFCEALDALELRDEPAFASTTARLKNRDALEARLETILAADDCAAWLERLLAAGIPAGPINTINQALADPQIAARGLLAQVDGRVFLRAPVKLSRTPAAVTTGPAEIGQHTVEVLAEAGFDTAEIAALLAEGAIGAPG